MQVEKFSDWLCEVKDEKGNGRLISTTRVSERVWESLAFRIVNGDCDLCESIGNSYYYNEAEAKQGHEKIINKWKNMIEKK